MLAAGRNGLNLRLVVERLRVERLERYVVYVNGPLYRAKAHASGSYYILLPTQ